MIILKESELPALRHRNKIIFIVCLFGDRIIAMLCSCNVVLLFTCARMSAKNATRSALLGRDLPLINRPRIKLYIYIIYIMPLL